MSILRDLQLDLRDPGLVEALRQLAVLQWTWNAIQAQAEQEQAARQCPEARCIDGIGQLRRQVHTFAYHDWAEKEGGSGIWLDPGFNRYMDRVAPETKVKAIRSKAGVGYSGGEPGPAIHTSFCGERRFVKTYLSQHRNSGPAALPAARLPDEQGGQNPPAPCSPSPTMTS